MLTVEEIKAVPLLSTLAAGGVGRHAPRCAGIHLAAGEFAVSEGGERAFFAVLAGKIEVVKQIDGVERTLGWRTPGAIFGEVPIALASPFPAGYRASEPSRVIRLDIPQYYALASASPHIATKVG